MLAIRLLFRDLRVTIWDSRILYMLEELGILGEAEVLELLLAVAELPDVMLGLVNVLEFFFETGGGMISKVSWRS